jgi:regulator of protease activity HflC (stomatin/prohibitin superfamily)
LPQKKSAQRYFFFGQFVVLYIQGSGAPVLAFHLSPYAAEVLMRRLLTVAFLLAVSFLAVKLLGAVGFFVFAAACALFYTFLSPAKVPAQLPVEDMQLVINRRFALSVLIFLILVFVFFYVISGIIGLEEARWQPLPFLLGTVWLRLFWSTILAVLTAVVVALAILLPIGYFGSRVMYGEYKDYKGHEGEAIYSAISVVLGISKGVWLVREGKNEVLHPPAGGLARFGGPGVLMVQEGHAVILERSGQLSRVVGRGVTWLQPFERVSMVIPLQTRGEHVIVKQVATKDRILIEEFEFWAFHKVDQGPEEMRIQSGQFAYNEDILLKKIWVMGGDDWSGAVQALSGTAARDVVGRYDLEEVVAIADQFRVDFKEALRQQINRVAKDFMGVDVIAVDIGKIKVPEDAEKRLLAKRLADWDVRIAESRKAEALTKGEAEAAVLLAIETARARAQSKMIGAIQEALAGGPSPMAGPVLIIILRFIEAMEKMADDPSAKVLFPYGLPLPELEKLWPLLTGGQGLGGQGLGDQGAAGQSAGSQGAAGTPRLEPPQFGD